MEEKPNWRSLLGERRGVVLLITLVVLVVLTAMVVEFDYGTRIQAAAAGNFRDDLRATYLAKAGVSAGQAILKYDKTVVKNSHDGFDEFWANPIPPYPVGDGFVSGIIEDESARLNINFLGGTKAITWKPVWVRLFQTLNIRDKKPVEAIMDWVDTDSTVQGVGGAEDSFYLSLDPPYEPRNGPMESLSEIRFIKGITPEIYEKLMTGCGGGPCFTVAPTKAVNTNTVSLEVCTALHNQLTVQFCNDLLSIRENQPSTFPPSWGGTANNPGFQLQQSQMIDFSSDHFSILATGEYNETKKTVRALVDRSGKNGTVLSWQADLDMPGI